MLHGRNLSLSSDFIQAIWTAKGELTKIDKKKLGFFCCSPLSSSSLEIGFQGPESEGFFERLKEAISRLPSNYESQILLDRAVFKKSTMSSALFPTIGLYTRLFLIESSNENPGTTSLKQLFEDIGLNPVLGSREDYLYIIRRILGQEGKGERFISPDITWEEDYIKASKSFIKAASLTDLPLVTWNNCLQPLYETSDDFICSFKIRMPDKNRIKKDLETKRRVSHALSVRKAHELADLESGTNISASEEVLMMVTSGKESLAYASLSIIMSDDNLKKLEERMQNMVSEINGATGAGFFVEGVGTLSVVTSHLPGASAVKVREQQMLSGNLSHMCPVLLDFNRYQEEAHLKFVSRASESCHLNLFSSTNLNFNAFICGASGSGKSFLMNSLLASFIQDFPKGSLAIFDVGGSYKKLIANLGGTSLELDAKKATDLIVAAFKRLKLQPNGYCKTLIENICGAGTHITHSHKVAIEDLLQSCSDLPFSLRVLSNEASERSEKAYEDIVLWLRPYLHWDERKSNEDIDKFLDNKIRAFDFKNLESDPLLQRLSILVLTQGIWDRLKSKEAERTIIVFDEVWKFFSQASGFLEDMYRTFRKYGAGIASVTQNLADYGNDSFAKLVITNSFNRILLQGAANSEILSRTLDLTESDIKRFLTISSKKNEYSEFWFGTPKFSQIMRLYPSQELFNLANSENIQKETTCV